LNLRKDYYPPGQHREIGMFHFRVHPQAALVLVVLLAVTTAHAQQTTLPTTPAGRALAEWLDAFNSGDRDRVAAFQQRYGVQGQPPDAELQFRAQTGGFDLLSVAKSEPLHIEFIVKERNSATRANGMLDVTASDPPRVTGPMLTALPPDASHLLGGDELKAARASIPFQRFSAWLDAFNTGDRSRIAAFLTDTWPSRDPEREMSMHAQSGGFNLRGLQEVTPTTISGFVEARDSDDFAVFNLAVEPDGAHRMTNLTLRLIPRPPGFDLPRLSDADLIKGLRARLEKESAADRFSGAMLVVKKGQTLFSGAYGLADRDKKIPNTLDTRFRIGSMNKMFTGTAILQLVQAGKIQLADPLGKYLPNYPNKAVAAKVTIHQLLTHTGGTGDIFGPEFDAHRLELRTLDDYVALYGKRDLLFEPGSRWQYSNYGMVLLGVVVERVTGMSYYDYVAQHIFKPAGMTRTGSEPESESVAGRSIGYTRSPGSADWQPNTDTLPYRGTSAGGGYSTVGDLVKYADALLGNKLLDAAHTRMLITGKTSTPLGHARYAYGFEDDRNPDGWGAVGHGGGAPGMNGELRIFPASGLVVAVLANLDPPAASRAWRLVELRVER
jgi:CubicO group peptidase (beta-lactamase class C family)